MTNTQNAARLTEHDTLPDGRSSHTGGHHACWVNPAPTRSAVTLPPPKQSLSPGPLAQI